MSSLCEQLVVGDRKKVQAVFESRKEEIKKDIYERLKIKERWKTQVLQEMKLEDKLREASLLATSIEQTLKQVLNKNAQLKQRNEARSKELSQQNAELAERRSLVFVQHFPDINRCQALRHSMVMEQLAALQRRHVQELLHIFPLQITGLQAPPLRGLQHAETIPCVTIAGLRLPDSCDQVHEVLQQSQAQQTLGAALGYMLQLSRLLAHYLSAPAAHGSSYQGSTSQIWEPRSASDPRPAPGAPKLPDAADLGLAVRLLERSVAMLCHAMMGAELSDCPEGWSPFAMLAWAFARAKLDRTETTQRILEAAASSGAGAPLPSVPRSAAGGEDGGGDPWQAAGAELFLGDPAALGWQEAALGAEDPAVADEWDIVHRPFLPPPPSQPDEVEHWSRAMFEDARENLHDMSGIFSRIRQVMPSLNKL
eukprot:CAMPEP_0177606644 /NCGR_PEP_ID=MMETSP0419_2-20121207/17423_1 /TAXON_ID=582737 /ORGANISM="Tetraselmis sp., Strain GSL018" /LENGTH=423 /DNA_ID=CAMNT_0019101031 /DNA_START=114 /DNA_END=1386 /DNA_ORIENTATION=-